jgi:rare lipoprotein A
MDLRASSFLFDGINDIVPKLQFDVPPPKPVLLTSLAPPAVVDTLVEEDAPLAPAVLAGIASMYNPFDLRDKTAGGMETASGEHYDELAWTAAIRIDLRDRFGGVRFGINYKPTYALVESGSKSVIVRINDVGPLRPGRIIDLNIRAMRYFDPSLELGLLNGVHVTPLAGTKWIPGPVGGAETINLAGDFAP